MYELAYCSWCIVVSNSFDKGLNNVCRTRSRLTNLDKQGFESYTVIVVWFKTFRGNWITNNMLPQHFPFKNHKVCSSPRVLWPNETWYTQTIFVYNYTCTFFKLVCNSQSSKAFENVNADYLHTFRDNHWVLPMLSAFLYLNWIKPK